MNSTTFKTVKTARTAIEADLMISALRAAGLHPVELSMSSHFSVAGVDISYPIQVPVAEVEPARELLTPFD